MCLFDVKHFTKSLFFLFFFDTRKTCGCRDEFAVSAVIINLPNFRKAASFFFFASFNFFKVFMVYCYTFIFFFQNHTTG